MFGPFAFGGACETSADGLRVRVPRGHEARAASACLLLRTLIPVVERYLGIDLDGELRLDLVGSPGSFGVDAARGVVRHPLRGVEAPDPRTAGRLGYGVGRVLWYRSTAERGYRGSGPRSPDWLVEAALLPLLEAWADRREWRTHLDAQAALLAPLRPLPSARLADLGRLAPRRRAAARAQCLLRGQSLLRRHPDVVRDLRAVLAAAPTLDGLEALEALTGATPEEWETRFADDLEAWCHPAADLASANGR